jgi:hypothetical protein
MVGAIDTMLSETNIKKARTCTDLPVVVVMAEGDRDASVILDAYDVKLEEEVEDEEEPVFLPETAVLINLDQRINGNAAVHQLCGINTIIPSCGMYRCCLLALAMSIHCHKSHTVHVSHSHLIDCQGLGKSSA